MSESEHVISMISDIFEVKNITQNLDVTQFEIEPTGLKEKIVEA